MKTIALKDQIAASAAIYGNAMTDVELLNLFASAATINRVLGYASDATIARVLDIASADTIARIEKLRSLQVPIVPDLDRKMYEATSKPGALQMSTWHTCGTTHCRGGWAVTFAGEAGKALEDALGTEAAARYIYEASTGRPAPNFYATDEDALEDIKRCASGQTNSGINRSREAASP